MPSDSISEHLFFKIFLGDMPQTPLALACAMHALDYNTIIRNHSYTMEFHFDYVA